MKKGMLIGAFLILIPGCAHVRTAVLPYLPKVEAGAADKGFELSIDTKNLGINQLCLSPDGQTAALLNKIPVFGKFIAEDLVGICEKEAAAKPAA